MSEREWRFYVDDCLICIERILSYCEGMSKEDFVSSNITYDATLRNLELIGEAVKNIPADTMLAHPQIPWSYIVSFRNRLAHAYFGLDDDIIWDVIRTQLHPLHQALTEIKHHE